MSHHRRGFLKRLAVTGIGLGTTAQIAGATTRQKVDIQRTLRANPTLNSAVDSKSKKLFHNADKGKDPEEVTVFNCAFAGSTVKILDVFETDTYGWQAYVGVTGSSATRNWKTQSANYQPETWDTVPRNRWSKIKWLNGDSSYDQVDPEEGYRGFYPKNGSDPKLPGWVEPALETTVGVMLTAARVNPYTSSAATIALGAEGILDEMAKEDGEKSIEVDDRSGKLVRYDEDKFGQEWWSVNNKEMGHYDRIATRMGDPKPGVDLTVTSSHSDGLGDSWGSEYDVFTWDFNDGGSVSAAESKTLNRTFSPEEKERYGIVNVSGGQIDDPQIKTTNHLETRVKRLSEEVEGELTRIALNPPTKINARNVH